MNKWDYHVRYLYLTSFNEELNLEGQEGWELIYLEKINTVGQAELDKWFAVFKKPEA